MESYPVKRQRLSDDPTQLRRWMRGDRRLHRRQTLVSDGVEVVATTVVVAVDVDENGTPIATSTVINPSPASSAPTLPSATSSSTFIASGSPTLTSILSPTASNLNVIPGPQLSSSFGNTTIPSTVFSSRPVSNSTTLSSTISSLRSTISSSSVSSSSTSDDSSLFPSSTGFAALPPPFIGGTSGGSESAPTGHGKNATSGSGGNTTSPPIVAGAVVGSVGAMAVILLVVVILSRWWRHHTRELDYHESQTGSSAELRPRNTSTTPDMFTRRRSFLPTAAAGFINRLSGGRQNRSSSPTLPQGAGERSFQKIHGRKLPSQFPSGLEEGPTSRDFEKGTPEVDTHQSVVSGSSSFYGRDSAAFFAAAASGHLSGPMPHPLFAPAVGVGAGTEPSLSGPPLNVDEIHEEAVRPGPARTPTFHSGGPQSSPYEPGPPPPVPVIAPEHRYHIQRNAPQPHRPGTNAAGALARNPPSTDSHGSRFSEDLPRIL